MLKVFNSVAECPELGEFVKRHHYLKSISRGNKICFALYEQDVIVGAALFGTPVGASVTKKYGKNTLELKRFVMLNGKDNRCSTFLGACLRYVRRSGICDRVISYADPEQGHEGTIYRATNFKSLGVQKYTTPYVMYGGDKVYARNIYNESKRAKLIKRLMNRGLISVQFAEPKHIYMYDFARRSSTSRPTESIIN